MAIIAQSTYILRCPRCNGSLFTDRTEKIPALQCLSCGKRPFETVLPLVLTRIDPVAGTKRRGSQHNGHAQ